MFVRLSVCLSGTGAHYDHTVHSIARFSFYAWIVQRSGHPDTKASSRLFSVLPGREVVRINANEANTQVLKLHVWPWVALIGRFAHRALSLWYTQRCFVLFWLWQNCISDVIPGCIVKFTFTALIRWPVDKSCRAESKFDSIRFTIVASFAAGG